MPIIPRLERKRIASCTEPVPHLAHLTLLVRDYDEALVYYVGKLGFTLVEDTPQPEQHKPGDVGGIAFERWVTIRPPGAADNASTFLLARAATPEQQAAIGDQAGGRVSCSSPPTISRATTPRSPPPASNGSARPRLTPMAPSPSSATCTAIAQT